MDKCGKCNSTEIRRFQPHYVSSIQKGDYYIVDRSTKYEHNLKTIYHCTKCGNQWKSEDGE